MVNIQTLITSGVLDLYVLGLASDEERAEVEDNLSKYPEIQEEINSIRRALILYASAHAVQVPDDVKASILQSLDKNVSSRSRLKSKETQPATVTETPKTIRQEHPVSWFKASNIVTGLLALGFLIAVAAAFYFFNKASAFKSELSMVINELSSLKAASESSGNETSTITAQWNFLRKRTVKLVRLNGNGANKNLSARLHYATDTKESLFDFIEAPATGQDEYLFLWAITNGRVSRIGKLEKQPDNGTLQKLNLFDLPQSFIITIEPVAEPAKASLDKIVLAGVVPRD
jgi:anti-sigma factor RsiW